MELSLQRRAWDAYDVYLFDIDGTLLSCADAVHYFAFCEALTAIAGRPVNLDGVVTHGNVDIGILRDALRLAGVPEVEWRAKLPEVREQMCRFVDLHASDFRIQVLPAVQGVLRHLHAKGALLGVATGNLERIGRAKLSRCGLLGQFDFGGYSDACESRHEVFESALAKAQALAGSHATVCVVGDTPADIHAARTNKVDVIATATGIYSYEALRAEAPDWSLHSLADLLGE